MQGCCIKHELMLCFPDGFQRICGGSHPVAEHTFAHALQPDAFELLYLAVEGEVQAVFIVKCQCNDACPHIRARKYPLRRVSVNVSVLPGFAPLSVFDKAGHAVDVQLEMTWHIFQTTGNAVAAFRQTCIGKRVLQHFIRNDEMLYLFGYGC